ncbi:MAG: hypothetical protein HQL47_02765 [Gammaproteobacteria bacterium]|nr:hypothetical protein [Gammaproteobacteria bacterium]
MGTFFGWVLGIIWMALGIGGIGENALLSGGLVFLLGLSMLPRVHKSISAFLQKHSRWRLLRWLTTGNGSWVVGASLLSLIIIGGPQTLGDWIGAGLFAGLAFFIFKSIRDKIDELIARAKGVEIEQPPPIPEPEPQVAETPMESEVRRQLQAARDQDSIRQLGQLRRKFDAFEKMLELKFEQEELTYLRYRQIVEEAFMGCIDNLRQIGESWAGIAGIDPVSIDAQLARNPSPEVRQTLMQRLELLAQTQAHIDQLRSSNEMAMTRLDEITIQLSRIQTKRGHASMELKDSLKELSSLSQGTQMYDIKR